MAMIVVTDQSGNPIGGAKVEISPVGKERNKKTEKLFQTAITTTGGQAFVNDNSTQMELFSISVNGVPCRKVSLLIGTIRVTIK